MSNYNPDACQKTLMEGNNLTTVEGFMMNLLSCHKFTIISPFLIPFSLAFIATHFFYVDVLYSLAKICTQVLSYL